MGEVTLAEVTSGEATLEEASGVLTWAAALVGPTSAAVWAERMSVPVSVAHISAAAWVEASDTLCAGASLGDSSTAATDIFAALAYLTTVGRSIAFIRADCRTVRRAQAHFGSACDRRLAPKSKPIGASSVTQSYCRRPRREMLAISTAKMPITKIPSNVPAPPIEAIGAPKPCNLSRLSRSAPMSVPRLPLI